MPAKLTTEQFIEKARSVHGDRYDYSKVEYVNNSTKVCIICKEHGEFWQKPIVHTIAKAGCSECVGKKRYTTESFISKAQKAHGKKFNYSKVIYVNNRTKVCIICPEHGEFWQEPWTHIKARGCPSCAGMKHLSTQQFIEKAKETHGNKYDYNKVEYINNKTKVCIICKKHGEFWIAPNTHLSGPKTGCALCTHKYKAIGIFDKNSINRYKYHNNTSISTAIKLRNRFILFLKKNKTTKVGSLTHRLQSYVMMDRTSFIIYYESLFEEGMTWENTHIDHHVPLSHFDPTSEDDMKIAWNWYNLRPLLGEDNLSKNATLPDDYEQTIETIKEIIETGCTDPSQLVFDVNKGRDVVRKVSI